MVRIRPAVQKDLDGIMAVEQETFGPLGKEAMASPEVMLKRIELCNEISPEWFWVAEEKGRIVGDMILQPTRLESNECVSWSAATDNGTLQRTFDRVGKNIYVVSLATLQDAPDGTSELLMLASLAVWAGYIPLGNYMFCSRMPGFQTAHQRTGIAPERYWQLKHKDGGPRDPMLRLYWEMSGGIQPYRFLKNGFPPDKKSGGHGVLFVLTDPAPALLATGAGLYRAGIIAGSRITEKRKGGK